MGSGVIQMGSYFGKMTPRGSGSFLNRIVGLTRPKNIKKKKKKVLKYAQVALGQSGRPQPEPMWSLDLGYHSSGSSGETGSGTA